MSRARPSLAVSGCSDAEDRLNSTVHAFADALNRDDVSAAASVTTDPAKASDSVGKLFDSLGKEVHVDVGSIARNDSGATFNLNTTWKFGQDGRNQWTYTTSGNATADGDDWKISWNPATVAPGLDAGPLSYSTLTPDPAARVLDRTGAELLTQHVVTLVNVSPGADLNALAALLNPTGTRDHRGVAADGPRPRRTVNRSPRSLCAPTTWRRSRRSCRPCRTSRWPRNCGCWPPTRP